MDSSTKPLSFKVIRQNPELIPPAKPTPNEFKPLSDIDDQGGLRFLIPIIQFYQRNPSMDGVDPVAVIRSAVAGALVHYYPLAGRLREHAARKLVVECTQWRSHVIGSGEGVLFIEADADVALQQLGGNLQPPFPCLEELLYDVPGSGGLINCPLILIQVTRLYCGGFILALRFNHTMTDATGIAQFMFAVAELARGATAPSVPPVWKRHLLNARDPPHVSRSHYEYDVVPDTTTKRSVDSVVDRSFFFGPAEISALRDRLPPHLRRCTTFEILTACLWRCRTTAVSPDPDEEVRLIYPVNCRKLFDPRLPRGYYGNAAAFTAAVSAAGKLSEEPLRYALELIMTAKLDVTEEYVRSAADLMVVGGRPNLTRVRSFLVSDLTHVGFEKVDYGWGEAVYGGVTSGGVGPVPGMFCLYAPLKNGIVVPVYLAADAMGVFVKELERMLKRDLLASAL